jgi:hypothetical protein
LLTFTPKLGLNSAMNIGTDDQELARCFLLLLLLLLLLLPPPPPLPLPLLLLLLL